MFSRRVQKYIIVYKLKNNKKILDRIDIELFANISVEISDKVVKDFKTHRCAIESYSILLSLIVKEKNTEVNPLIYNL